MGSLVGAGLLVEMRLARQVRWARATSHVDDVQWCTTCYPVENLSYHTHIQVVALVRATLKFIFDVCPVAGQ